MIEPVLAKALNSAEREAYPQLTPSSVDTFKVEEAYKLVAALSIRAIVEWAKKTKAQYPASITYLGLQEGA